MYNNVTLRGRRLPIINDRSPPDLVFGDAGAHLHHLVEMIRSEAVRRTQPYLMVLS